MTTPDELFLFQDVDLKYSPQNVRWLMLPVSVRARHIVEYNENEL